MADYRLPMDADGVKYHGTVDQNEENPGHFMYGLDENGNKRIIRTDEQGNVLTKVTGSKVERIELLPATSLRDTSTFNGDYIDTDKYEKMLFFVNSTLDAEVYIGIRIAGSNIAIWKDGEWANTYPGEMGSLEVEEGRSGEVRILNTKYEWLNTLWSDRMQVRVRAKETPTEGSISIYAFGVI